ncbi:hypothetical protein Q4574_20445 [Aliiglaciecola sp. 3_MG-2023]|uniref:hypothetical protein n=1 Tax=Aliiglaciecola sp. 3_MG-2023 TaxID=3062644 RepID=UPI0026E23A7A|nr:hypothetical protein [Aliiglaciecola sp. 3_MG-2023]MDO6695681.1 hypothetical protein [Aliiglaciecola sp. 3_MG-2023]
MQINSQSSSINMADINLDSTQQRRPPPPPQGSVPPGLESSVASLSSEQQEQVTSMLSSLSKDQQEELKSFLDSNKSQASTLSDGEKGSQFFSALSEITGQTSSSDSLQTVDTYA